MKNILYFTVLVFLAVFFSACDRDEDHDHNEGQTEFDYRIVINTPNADTVAFNDLINLDIDFISDNGAPVHHVNVRIYNKSTGGDIYNAPSEAHVHVLSGTYKWEDDFALTVENGIVENSEYILEARVWGHTFGLEEIVQSKSFVVLPQ